MKKKTFLFLLVALALFALVLAGYLFRQKQGAAPVAMGQPLFENLDPNLVERIRILDRDNGFVLEKTAQGWMVDTGFLYPADFDKVSRFLRTASQLKVGRAFDGDPETRKRLNLLSPKDAAEDALQSAGALFMLEDSAGSRVASILAGKERPSREEPSYPQGQFLMINEDPRIFLVDRYYQTERQEPGFWWDTLILRVPVESIARITAAAKDQDSDQWYLLYDVARPDAASFFEAVGMAEELELDQSKVNRLAGFLGALNLEDVRPADPDSTPEQGLFVAFEDFDGLAYTVFPQQTSMDRGCAVWITVEFVGLDSDGEQSQDEEQAQWLVGKANDLNARLAGWIFSIGQWRCETLFTKPQELAAQP
ncbi:MAG: DUF4340 domain-containing protein [Desulfatibacillaceae bacterium]|nr:DUF4340 domain-containing protein [Desulfatibacillaceae bacterium]